MFMMFINRGEANIETLPLNIFVFVNEVLNKISAIFPSLSIASLSLMRCVPRYHLEIYLRPPPQNI